MDGSTVTSVSTLILAEAQANAAQTPSVWTVVVGPAVTAAIVAGLVSLIQVVVTGRRERNKQLLEFRLRQINELYAPILFLLAQDLSINKKLKEATGGDADWHLLDDLANVRSSAPLLRMAKNIVSTNSSIKEVLVKNAGLSLKTSLPGSYHDFITHADLVNDAVDTGAVPENVSLKYFPKHFEKDIEDEYAQVVKRIQKQLKRR